MVALREERMSAGLKIALCATAAMISLSDLRISVAQTAQPAASGSTGLEEIVVTARRREERVQTIPLAITAFSGEDIEKKHINDLSVFRRCPGRKYRFFHGFGIAFSARNLTRLLLRLG